MAQPDPKRFRSSGALVTASYSAEAAPPTSLDDRLISLRRLLARWHDWPLRHSCRVAARFFSRLPAIALAIFLHQKLNCRQGDERAPEEFALRYPDPAVSPLLTTTMCASINSTTLFYRRVLPRHHLQWNEAVPCPRRGHPGNGRSGRGLQMRPIASPLANDSSPTPRHQRPYIQCSGSIIYLIRAIRLS